MPFEFDQVDFHYEEKDILVDLSFSLPSNEIVGILGPNGCGKTTLLKLMAGVLKPSRGNILLKGKALHSYPRKSLARIVSVLPQDTWVDFPFTALEVVLMGRAPYLRNFQWETQGDLDIARANMELSDCWNFAHQDIRQLSGGERERVLLARALTQEPEVLLLDEPTTHLDLKHQAETHHLLEKLRREKGLTILTVLHDLNFASRICQRVLLLHDKKLLAAGSPQEVLQPPMLQKLYGVEVKVLRDPTHGESFFLSAF